MRSQEYDTLVDKEDAEAERLPTVEESTTEGINAQVSVWPCEEGSCGSMR